MALVVFLLAVLILTGQSVPQPDALIAGKDVPAPTKLHSRPLVYPSLARQARVQGLVILAVTVDEEGRPAEVKVLRGIPIVDDAAIDAIKASRYAPTAVDGVRRRVKFVEHLLFYLSDRDRVGAAASLAEDQHLPAEMRIWAISELLQVPAKYRMQVSETLSGVAKDPDLTIATAAKEALDQLARR